MDTLTKLKLIHYSDKPLRKLYSTYGQIELSTFGKPCGLWLSEDSAQDGWRDWCLSEGFREETLISQTEVELVEPNKVLILSSAEELDLFTREYSEVDFTYPYRNRKAINWSRVADNYKGIIITPYIYERRMSLYWYYGWDCASGCIWDVSCIRIKENEK